MPVNPKGYGLPEGEVQLIEAVVLDVMRQDALVVQKKLSASADLAGALSNETGTGAAVFGTSPVFTTQIDVPNLRLRNATIPIVGNATLVAGTATVSTSAATASSYLQLQRKTAGGTIGELTYTVGAGTFTITSSSNLDTSVVTWNLFNGY